MAWKLCVSIGVNGEPHVVPVDELQDKSDRYFYQESLELKPNEVYISKFDLNMEYLGIELPIKPVYRLITPIDLSNGERLGYVVVNILGQPVAGPYPGSSGIGPWKFVPYQ